MALEYLDYNYYRNSLLSFKCPDFPGHRPDSRGILVQFSARERAVWAQTDSTDHADSWSTYAGISSPVTRVGRALAQSRPLGPSSAKIKNVWSYTPFPQFLNGQHTDFNFYFIFKHA